VIGFRIVDLFCPAKGLVIELDFGFRTMRFTNRDLMTNPDGVLAALKLVLDGQPERWPNRRGHQSPITSP
jgi:very-short-patch-repair endonuclease